MKVDFDILKSNISLPDFLRDQLGWVFAEGSTYKNPKMTSPSGDQTIVIRKNAKDFYTYWDIHNDSIKGRSIIDLMADHVYRTTGQTISFRRAGEILQTYIDSGKTVLPENSSFNLSNELLDSEFIIRTIRECKPLSDFSFFVKRGFNPQVLSTKEWKGVFMERRYISNENSHVKSYINTCVRLVNPSGVQGFSQRNESFKGAMGNRYDTIASSNIDKSSPLKIHLCESLLDGLAYYQMNYFPGPKENVLFISTEGSVTQGQIHTIQTVIDKNKVNSIELNYDNDIAGMMYAIKSLNLNFGDKSHHIESLSVSKGSGVGDSHLIFDIEIAPQAIPEELLSVLIPKPLLLKFFSESEFEMTINSTADSKHVYRYAFPPSKDFLKEVIKHLIDYKFGRNMMLNTSIEKDFNDDLNTCNNKKIN